ncbi:MAG: Na+/H+ antiporter NhaA [Pirellula sp.]|jgi:NhaA family Na+:H+ antiporter|nr:Na+/H+ antiporter NhaA [Pirellula sp.]
MAKKPKSPISSSIPKAPVNRWLVPVKSFLEIEAASGVLLVLCTVAALILANSPWAKPFADIWHTHVSLFIGDYGLEGELGHLIINDALMTIFFFVVGLEVKREIVGGELRDPRKALLPIVGALGGVLTPATIYLMFQSGELAQRGWAIPMATDIAFVVGILALFGSKIPFGLKIFLLTLAIVDDLIAVLVIAIVFTEGISMSYLTIAILGFVFTYFLNRIGVRSVAIYLMVGSGIWIAFHHAGVHPTIAGVVLGLLTPAKAWIEKPTFVEVVQNYWEKLNGTEVDEDDADLPVDIEQLQFIAREALSPLHRLEMFLHPWVAFVIMPVFAFANAGVQLEVSALTDSVSLAIAAGLAIGKPLGILLFCSVAIWLGWTQLPKGVRWPTFIAGACLGGIGFTMALFLNSLAFPADQFPELESAGKVGTLMGSCLSAAVGCGLLIWSTRKPAS